MSHPPRAGPRPVRNVPVFEQARTQLLALNELMDTDPYYDALFLLATEDLSMAQGGPRLAPADDAQEQAARDWLRTRLQQDGTTALARLVEHLHRVRPAMAAVYGRFLPTHLTTIILDTLGRRPLAPIILEVEQLSPTNPLRVVAYTADGMLVEIPHQATARHLLELASYRHAWRPLRPRGPRPKPPGAPRTPRTAATDVEALRAWMRHQEGATRDQIAQDLLPQVAITSDKDRRRVRATVDRRIARGRRLASVPPPHEQKK